MKFLSALPFHFSLFSCTDKVNPDNEAEMLNLLIPYTSNSHCVNVRESGFSHQSRPTHCTFVHDYYIRQKAIPADNFIKYKTNCNPTISIDETQNQCSKLLLANAFLFKFQHRYKR